MSALLVAAFLAAAPGPRDESLAFGWGSDWVVVDSAGAIVRRFKAKHPDIPEQVRDLAMSRDGKLVVVAAFSEKAGNVVLYLWSLADGVVQQVGGSVGFHAAPQFSADGKWLTFAHHATLGGPAGMHETGAYAQLFRQALVPSLGVPEALTSSDGCHMESSSISGSVIYFAHANCRGGRRIEALRDGQEKPITSFDDRLGEPSLSADGRWLLATKIHGDVLEIVELDLKAATPQPRSLWTGARLDERFRPQYLGSSRDVVFQKGLEVLVLRRKLNMKSEVVGRVR